MTITDEYRTAKCMRRQYERAWRRDKSSENHSRLRQQINRCNHILNRNKGRFYRDLVSDNCGDGKKLWQALNRILSRSNSTVLPSLLMKDHWQTDLVRFSLIKLKRSETPSNTPDLSFFTPTRSRQLSVPFKLSLIDPCPTHIVKQCIDILLPSLTKLVNLSLKNAFSQILLNKLLSHLSSKSPPFQKRT